MASESLTVRGMIDDLERRMFPHQESESEQESFTPEGRDRVAEWIAETVRADVALRKLATEFVEYWTKNAAVLEGGCGFCGGLPHADTCFVGRFEKAVGVR